MLMTFEGVDFDWVEKEDNRVAVGADEVIIALGGNPAHVSRYIRDIFPDYKFQWSGGKVGRAKWYVYEPGVYQLIFSSSLANIAPQKIERFQRWVFQDVLPNLRKTGLAIDESRFDQDEINRLNQVVADRDARIEFLLENIDFSGIVKHFLQECIVSAKGSIAEGMLLRHFSGWLKWQHKTGNYRDLNPQSEAVLAEIRRQVSSGCFPYKLGNSPNTVDIMGAKYSAGYKQSSFSTYVLDIAE